MTPIALQARMLQSGIAYWQAWAVMNKNMLLAMTGQLHKLPDNDPGDPSGLERETPALGRRRAVGA